MSAGSALNAALSIVVTRNSCYLTNSFKLKLHNSRAAALSQHTHATIFIFSLAIARDRAILPSKEADGPLKKAMIFLRCRRQTGHYLRWNIRIEGLSFTSAMNAARRRLRRRGDRRDECSAAIDMTTEAARDVDIS